MIRKTLICTILAGTALNVAAQKNLVFEGNYQGKNIYVQNPIKDDGVGFCTNKVTVNGNPTSDEINSSAYEIDFTKLKLKLGDPVSVVIEHGAECTPKVLNPEVLKPTSTYKIKSIEVTPAGLLKWSTTNETGKLPFIIEQYRWNKWIPIGEVDGLGTPEEHAYEFQVNPHSGENQVRVKQVDHTKKPNISPARTFMSTEKEVDFQPKKVADEVTFYDPDKKVVKTRYEVYDAYGNIVKKGFGDKVDLTNLEKGAYYLNYDNKNEKFIKK
jgi:hypothetical protein